MLQRLPAAAPQTNAGAWIRLASVASLALIWLISLITLLSGWDPGVYLSLELVWALPPIALQFAFGADILWRYRNGVLAGVLLPTLFLAAADMLAIGIGIWTIDPAQSLHLLIAGVLPFEELIFFLLTNTLIVFGVTLSLAPESRPRLNAVRQRLQRGASSPPNHVRRSAEW
jgi:lycopene cyclase domain-containing protein